MNRGIGLDVLDNRVRWVTALFIFFAATLAVSVWTSGRTIEPWQGLAIAILLCGTIVAGLGAARAILARWMQ